MYELRAGDIGYVAGRWPLDHDLPTVIFIHGSGGTGILWHAQVEALAGKMNTIALDLPGHGRSGGEGMNRIEDYAAAVEGFIESVKAPQPVPCGFSIGGAIVLQLLLESPENFEAGIVVNSGARLRVLPLIFEAIEGDYTGFVNSSYASVSQKTDPSIIKPLVDDMAACPPGVTAGDFAACDSFDVMGRVAEIGIPLLVLTASEDRLTPLKYGTYLAGQVRNSSLTNIEGAGHLSPMEKPEEVSRAILEFVSSL